MEKIYEWEKKIDKSREKHKHIPAKGGLKDVANRNVKYCYGCDEFYYSEKR